MADYYVKVAGNDTTGDGSVGNPYATPGKALGVAVAAAAGWNIYVEVGTYPVTSTTANVAGGRLNFSQTGSQTGWNRMIGHAVGDISTAARFVLALGVGLNTTVITTNNANSWNEIRNFEVTGNATGGASALSMNGRSNRAANFKCSGFTGGGNHIVTVQNNASVRYFEISGGNTGNFSALHLVGSSQAIASDGDVYGNAGRGVEISTALFPTIERVRSYLHTGGNGYGFFVQSQSAPAFVRCDAYGNAQSGFHLFGSDTSMVCDGCLSVLNGVYGWHNQSAQDAIELVRCGSFGNTSGAWPLIPRPITGHVTLTGNPYTDAANGDFRLNSTAGAGAAAKGIVSATPRGIATYPDIGSMQGQGGSGVTRGRIVNAGGV